MLITKLTTKNNSVHWDLSIPQICQMYDYDNRLLEEMVEQYGYATICWKSNIIEIVKIKNMTVKGIYNKLEAIENKDKHLLVVEHFIQNLQRNATKIGNVDYLHGKTLAFIENDLCHKHDLIVFDTEMVLNDLINYFDFPHCIVGYNTGFFFASWQNEDNEYLFIADFLDCENLDWGLCEITIKGVFYKL